MEKSKDIYKMKLHDYVEIGKLIITRVSGGWIYEIPRGNTRRHTATFIPFDNEFQCEK